MRVSSLVLVLALGGSAGCVRLTEARPSDSADANGVPSGAAGQLLDQLNVRPDGSMAGYSRDRFAHWRRVGRGCDIRDSVLRRDAASVRSDGCNVIGGRWLSSYDRVTVTKVEEVDIDHMVPLANAWRTGAAQWNDGRRSDFANDLTRPQLIAVTRSSNRAKGDQNPAQWKPPNKELWCEYAQDWITVKRHWRLSVTAAEKRALGAMLETCR
ncbi:HNH endonuclease family protein [Pilimelia columellifera]|uniref:HNH endonuclease family protein n=1 Tax=Pilimelia columellifera TaxID=706574 RepID=UPI003CD0A29B